MGARVATVSGLKGLLDAYRASNPSLLIATHTTRPPSFNKGVPAAWVGSRSEPRISHDSGTRTRIVDWTIGVVDEITDNEETMGRLDAVVDGILDLITDTPHVVTGAITSVVSITSDEEEAAASGVYYAKAVLRGRTEIIEGR
jgi:hypothetical protein